MSATFAKNEIQRIAIFGGKGKHPKYYGFGPEYKVRIYRSPKDGSELDTSRLVESIKMGSFDLVVILTRFNAHTVTKRVRKVCRRYGIPVEIRNK